MIKDIYFEDYQMGETRKTLSRTITETDIVFHAGHTGDFFPHHMDEEFCRNSIFKKRVAHGTMTFSIGIGLTAQEVNPQAITYGYEKLRFPQPVFIGDTLHTEIEITEKKPYPKNPDFGQVVETCRVLNQHKQVVLYCEHLLLVNKKSKNV